MKRKVETLAGVHLDAAVAHAEGRLVVREEPGWDKGNLKKLRADFGGEYVVRWYARVNGEGPETDEVGGWEPLSAWGQPSSDWTIGGQIIEREKIDVSAPEEFSEDQRWYAGLYRGKNSRVVTMKSEMRGETPLIAAMRAYVHSKFGDEVELP